MYRKILSKGNWIGFSKPVARGLKSIDAALLLSEILNQIEYFNEDEVFITHEHFEEQILLSAHKVRKAAKTLINNNLIEVNRKGVPAKNYYKLHKSFTTSIETLLLLDVEKFNNCKLKNSTTINNTKEIILDNNIRESENSEPINFKSNTPVVQIVNTPIDQTHNYISENSDYIDFNSLISQGAKIGLIGQAKAILQTELNCLVFDDFDNKVIQRMLNSIKSNLKAFKHRKGDYSSVTTKNVIDAFKTSVNAVKSNSKQESISLNYLNSCLTTDLYINADKKQVQNDDLSIYQDVVKQTFKHYNRFTAFDKAKLREIIAAIEEAGAEDVYAEFKSLFANLPAYILDSRSYQSVSFVASKINDLLNITSTDAQIKSYHNYTLLKESYGEDRAREMISKILKKKQNESSKVH